MEANQRRSCLALGAVIGEMDNNEKAHAALGHLHTWLDTDLHRSISQIIFNTA